MKYLKFGVNVLITIFDLFILWVLVLCVMSFVQPSLEIAISKSEAQPYTSLLVALIFIRLIYVLLHHMGVFKFYDKLTDEIALLIKARFAK